MPEELRAYLYRKEFSLSAKQLEEEPADQFFMNWQIRAWIKDKERLEAEHG